MLLGFVLGPMMEENLRRAMLMSKGDPSVFFTRPISLGFMIATVLILVVMIAARGAQPPRRDRGVTLLGSNRSCVIAGIAVKRWRAASLAYDLAVLMSLPDLNSQVLHSLLRCHGCRVKPCAMTLNE